MKHRNWIGYTVLASCVVTRLGAQEIRPADQKLFKVDLPSLELAEAADRLGKQNGIRLAYPGSIARLRLPAVAGELTAEQIVVALIGTKPLSFRSDAPQAFELLCVSANCRALGSRLESEGLQSSALPEVFVLGGRWAQNADIPRTPNGPLPVTHIGREAIEAHGGSLTQILRDLVPANAGWSGGTAPGTIRGASAIVNLRGLGPSQTVILIDGRRVTPVFSGGEALQPDIEAIPINDVERIEVLPTTASAIYGGSATGGVVNIVLRHDVSRSQIAAEIDRMDGEDAGARRVSASYSQQVGNANVAISGSYAKAPSPDLSEAAFFSKMRKRLLINDQGYFNSLPQPPLGARTNYQSVLGQSLFGEGTATFGTVTEGFSGVPTTDSLRGGAGTYTFTPAPTAQALGGEHYSTVAQTELGSIAMSARMQFGERITADLQLGWNRVERSLHDSAFPSQSFSGIYLRSDAENNPFDQDLYVTIPLAVGDSDMHTAVSTRRIIAVVQYQLARWTAALDYSRTLADLSIDRPDFAGTLDLSSVNLFQDPLNADYLREQAVTLRGQGLESAAADTTLRVAGPLRLFGNFQADLTCLFEWRSEVMSKGDALMQNDSWFSGVSQPITAMPERSQSIRSAYLEGRIPIISGSDVTPTLSMQVSLRHDRYKAQSMPTELSPSMLDVPTSGSWARFARTTPLAALLWVPSPSFRARLSYASGFLPPSLAQLSPSVQGTTPPGAFADASRGGESTGEITTLFGGNPGLQPERSESWSVGVIFTPPAMPGTRVSVDHTRIRKRGEIQPAADILYRRGLEAFELNFAGRVEREALKPGDPKGVGRISKIDASAANIARTDVSVWDVDWAQRKLVEGLGELTASVLVTYQPRFARQLTPEDAFINFAGVSAENPGRVKFSGRLMWEYEQFSASWFMQGVDRYIVSEDPKIVRQQGGRSVDAQWQHDLRFQMGFDPRDGEGYSTRLELGVRNVFNAAPAFDASQSLNNYASPLLGFRPRTFYVRFTTGFP